MDTLKPKHIATPRSLLIEQTALQMAAVYYEAGRNTGLKSKHKTPQAFAKANVEKFIPVAVSTLMDMLGSSATSPDMKEEIYQAILERTNDQELSNVGIKSFENNTPFLPELPKIYEKPDLERALEKGMKDFTKGLRGN